MKNTLRKLLLLWFFSGSLDSFSQSVDTTQPLRQFDVSKWGGAVTSASQGDKIITGTVEWRLPVSTPDTLRAICLVTLFPNGIAHSRMGFVVIEQGKRPVYLDCNKKALKLPQAGWGYEVITQQKIK